MRRRFGLALAAAGLLAAQAGTSARADEVSDALEAALAAWRAGDVALAKEELDYAAALVDEAQAAGLSTFLPEALPGWTREDGEATAAPAAMFGGGLSASAVYARDRARIEIRLFADNPMVAAMAPMLASPQMMAAAGEMRRAGRQRYVVTPDGEIMALIDGRVMAQLSGSGALEDKIAYFEAIDFEGVAGF